MGRKVFVSYKYMDNSVLQKSNIWGPTTVRHYVDELSEILSAEDHIYKGENDGEDMSTLSDASISTKLGNKIFDSSITIVMISPKMKHPYLAERDQWMPWEISYSLRNQSRQNQTSKTNGVLAVVLPDIYGNYDYYLVENACTACNCRILKTNFLFQILKDNMFNIKSPQFNDCANHTPQSIFLGQSSYIYSTAWAEFKKSPDRYLDIAAGIRDNIDDYNITKLLS